MPTVAATRARKRRIWISREVVQSWQNRRLDDRVTILASITDINEILFRPTPGAAMLPMRKRDTSQHAASGLRWSLLLIAFTSLAGRALSQAVDSTRSKTVVEGLFTVTTKGISNVPSITLGKPAAILNVSIARSGFAFEPELKYGLNGKPWSFIFWGRYRLDRDNFHLTIGEHPSVNFKTITVSINQTQTDVIEARRYLAGELYPSYSVSRNVGVGVYYLYSHGFEADIAKNTHFLALRTTLSNVPRSDGYSVRFVPQVYYLKQDARDGTYGNCVLTFGRKDFPFSIGAQVNKTIRTRILEGDDYIWNVSLSYSIK
jgi:hypothetical protein